MAEVKLIFNDRNFEDGWAEPYLVTLCFSQLSDAEIHCPAQIALDIQKCTNDMLDDGIECSSDGVEQILAKFKETEKRLVSWKLEEFIPAVCFGGNEYYLD